MTQNFIVYTSQLHPEERISRSVFKAYAFDSITFNSSLVHDRLQSPHKSLLIAELCITVILVAFEDY